MMTSTDSQKSSTDSQKHRNVFLIGMMAVGKTTVGRYLAEELGLEFMDADQVIEERAGADIAWIFDVEGEGGFRDREEEVVDELTRADGIVLATGGGVVLRAQNRERLALRGTVIYLTTPIAKLVERTNHDKRRPLLEGVDPKRTFKRLMSERAPLYEAIADYQFVTNRSPARLLARQIANTLKKVSG